MSASELSNNITDYRKHLLKLASGFVLETGVGSSRNMKFYPRDVPVTVIAIDYSPNALELALEKDPKGLDITYLL